MALYRAKANGKGQAVEYDPELDRERIRVAELEGLFKNAIGSGAIEAVFQPLVSASTGAVTGLEALARLKTATGIDEAAPFSKRDEYFRADVSR
ncbi:hypothetical protein AB9F39_35590, partial [Rhizobium leguminosarum]